MPGRVTFVRSTGFSYPNRANKRVPNVEIRDLEALRAKAASVELFVYYSRIEYLALYIGKFEENPAFLLDI